MSGITNGSVDREWARRHHRKWVEAEEASGAAEEAADAALPTTLGEQLTER